MLQMRHEIPVSVTVSFILTLPFSAILASMVSLVHRWHTMLDMPKYDTLWHEQDMADELAEYQESSGLIDTWSELSDVVYTYTRARWSGHTTITFPFSRTMYYVGALYMFPKYTLRWTFFRRLGHHFDPNLQLTEVRNPKKVEKLKNIAEKYGIDPDEFTTEAVKLMRRCVLLK